MTQFDIVQAAPVKRVDLHADVGTVYGDVPKQGDPTWLAGRHKMAQDAQKKACGNVVGVMLPDIHTGDAG